MHEAQHCALSGARLFLVVNADGGRTHDPVGQPTRARFARAGGQAGLADDGSVFAQKVYSLRLAVRIVDREGIPGLGEKALKGFKLEFEQGPLVHITAPADVHISNGPGPIVGLVVLQPVGPNQRVASAELRVALNDGVEIGSPRQALTGHDDRLGTLGFDRHRSRCSKGRGARLASLRMGLLCLVGKQQYQARALARTPGVALDFVQQGGHRQRGDKSGVGGPQRQR